MNFSFSSVASLWMSNSYWIEQKSKPWCTKSSSCIAVNNVNMRKTTAAKRQQKSDVPADRKKETPPRVPKKRKRTKEDMLSACRKGGCLEAQEEETMEIEIARWECSTEKGTISLLHLLSLSS